MALVSVLVIVIPGVAVGEAGAGGGVASLGPEAAFEERPYHRCLTDEDTDAILTHRP